MTQTKNVNGAVVADQPSKLPCPDSSASFWHSQPNIFLFGHRTTPELPSSADVVVVGSGITGASAARYLTENENTKDMSVVMLEAREICWGATGRNGGHCQPLVYGGPIDVAEFEIKNVTEVRKYVKEHQVDCEWRDVTACHVFWSQDLFDQAKKDVEGLKKADAAIGKMTKVIETAAELEAHQIRSSAAGAVLVDGAAQLWPYKYVTSIVQKLINERKINLQTNTPVTSIGHNNTLHTHRGSIRAKHIILATNGYTSHLVQDLTGVIVPVRCEMSALHPSTRERLAHSYGMVGYNGAHVEHDDYLVQRPFVNGKGGHLMFGGGRENAMYNCVGESEDDVVDPGEADYLRRVLPQQLMLGTDAELKASHQWTGIKGHSRDKMPWIGKIKNGLWISAGYSGHGMPVATLGAKAVVTMIANADQEDYDETCRQLVAAKELPRDYILTQPRLMRASGLPSVWEQDVLGVAI